MSKIFALGGFLLTIFIVVLFNSLTGFQLHTLSFLFIVPIGGLLIGAAAAAGLFYGYLRYNQPIKSVSYLFGALLGVGAMFGTYYVSYLTTYVDAENNINHSFKGDPISNFEIDGRQIDFFNYLTLEKDSKSQFYFRGRPVGGEADSGRLGNILYYLQFIASALAGAIMGLMIVGDKRFCAQCKKYSKEKELFKFDIDQYEPSIHSLADAADNPSKLKSLAATIHLKDEKVNSFAQADIEYCPSCYDSRLLIRVFRLDSNNNFEENSKLRQIFSMDEKVVKDFVENS